MKKLLVLTPKSEKPTKTLDSNLEKISSFDAGWLFKFETVNYKSIHPCIKKILALDTCFIVLGELNEYGQQIEANDEYGPRRKKKGTPTIQDRQGTEIVLDLDDHVIKGFEASDIKKVEGSITRWLRKRKINCDVTWQITSGQKLNTEEARIRLYIETEKSHSLLERKVWSQSENIMADGSVYTCSQPIYTAPPIIEGAADPIKQRFGFIKGKDKFFLIPNFSKEEIQSLSSYQRGGATYDFNDSSLPDDVLSGAVYRRYFMPLAFHYANLLKGDREAVFSIIAAKASQVKSREFNSENTYEYIDQAIDKISQEQEESVSLSSAEDIVLDVQKEVGPVPEFPEGILETWPDPWPMIWRTFRTIPRETEETLLIPTILSLNAFFLRANYVTAYNRRPNMLFLNLTPSTGNKDVNSKNVIRDLDRAFRAKGSPVSLFSDILSTESSITADISFLKSFNDDDSLFWINTEATRIFQQLKTSGGNSSVAALSDKLIEVVDGHEITGKTKSDAKTKTISNPNCQILFYAQPETIEQFIDDSMVDSGLFGRALLSIIPELKFNIDEYSMFHAKKKNKPKISGDFYDFYSSQKFNMSAMSTGKKVLKPSDKSLEMMDEWARETVAPLMAKDDSMQKVLSRIGNSAEQLYCIVLGICQIYDAYKDRKVRDEIPVLPMLPLLEYWAATKVYAIENYVESSLDPLADSVLELLKGMIGGVPAMQRQTDLKILKEHSMIPASQFFAKLNMNKKLSRKLSADGDKRNVTVRTEGILRLLIHSGSVVEREIGTRQKRCFGIPRD